MSKLWRVAWHEYTRHVCQKSFIAILLSLPATVALTIGIVALMTHLSQKDHAVGYVDQAGVLADPLPAPKRGRSPNEPGGGKLVPLVPYGSEEEARQALEAEEIQAYYVVTADYYETNRVELVYVEPPGDNVGGQFWDFMQINRLADLPPEVARRVAADSNLIVRLPGKAPGSGRQFSAETFLSNLMPFIVGMAFIMLLFTSSGYVMGVVAEEKENRMMEVLVTSVSPNQLIVGKIGGILGILLTQVTCWIAFAALAVWIGGRPLEIGLLRDLKMDGQLILMVMAVAAPAYVLIAALMTTLGAVVAEAQEAQQSMVVFVLPIMMPFWLFEPILKSPDSPLTLGLSLFPVTSMSTISIRLAFSQVLAWQIATSAVLTTLCAAGAIWMAARAFRLAMLRYGQRLRLGEIVGRRRET
jgi:ABC-2 type transport system permease protein